MRLKKIIHVFENLTDEQKELIDTVLTVQNREDAESFLMKINPYVIPFQEVTAQTLKNYFLKRKVKTS